MGLTFDSRWEAERWGQLKAMERAGIVTQLERQIKYGLSINDVKICDYIADFRYLLEEENGLFKLVVEDAKGKSFVHDIINNGIKAINFNEIAFWYLEAFEAEKEATEDI